MSRNILKTVILITLIMSMMSSLFACSEQETKIEDEYFVYTLLDDNTYSIGAKDKDNLPIEVYIPQTFNGKLVTKIAEKGFFNCNGVEYVVLSDKITSIGNEAFARCTTLVQVDIPQSVTAFGKGAFGECGSLDFIQYSGTMSDWDNILKASNWDAYVDKAYVINCLDGQIQK